jgi:hypothetical protein
MCGHHGKDICIFNRPIVVFISIKPMVFIGGDYQI